MSENSHIDKIFKDGLGERNFAGVDAMWQKMEAELEKDDTRKRKPVFYLLAGTVLFTMGLFTFFKLNQPANISANSGSPVVHTSKPADKTIAAAEKMTPAVKDANTLTRVDNTNSNKTDIVFTGISMKGTTGRYAITVTSKRKTGMITTAGEVSEENAEAVSPATDAAINTSAFSEESIPFAERMYAGADLISSSAFKQKMHGAITAAVKPNSQKATAQGKREIPKPQKISIEVVAGRDFLRMNRKAGSYVGVRVNRLLDHGTAITFGLNYATHIVFDSYRLASKPSDQKMWDARLNNIASIRMPVYLQRQMGASKFSMMLGLVPTYITHAEVYNVPDSYTGNPEPYRKFTLGDINRFNVLFGAGLKYSPTKWVAIELSGSYSLTGMVKDGYKNQSRVNDNFKSIQAGFAFRLK